MRASRIRTRRGTQLEAHTTGCRNWPWCHRWNHRRFVRMRGPLMRAARQHLPNRRRSIAFTFEFESHRYRATASHFDDGRLAEIFLDTDKAGTPLQLNAETAAVLASLCLQHGVDAK